MIELVKDKDYFDETKNLLDKIKDKDSENYTKLKSVFDKNILDKVELKLKDLILEVKNKIENNKFSDEEYNKIKEELSRLKKQIVNVEKIEDTEEIVDLLNKTFNQGNINRKENLSKANEKINSKNENTVYFLNDLKEIYDLLNKTIIKNLNLEKYNVIIRELDKIDTGIIEKSNDKYYFDLQLGGDYNIRNDENKLDINNILLGVRLGTNHTVYKDVKLGTFFEYSNDYLDTYGIGISNYYSNKEHILKSILRYRFVTNYNKVMNHNIDLYSKYGYKYTKDNLSITGNIGLLATYTSDTLIDDNVLLTGAFKTRFDFSGKLDYYWFYFEPIFSLKFNTKQKLIQIDMPNNERVVKQKALDIIDFKTRLGINPNITENIKFVLDFEAGIKKYTKLSIGIVFEK